MKKWFLELLECWQWEDSFGALVFVCLIFGAGLLVKQVTFDHVVRYYYLKGDMENGLVIAADINWNEDKEIQLDRSITYPEAIQMVKELNSTLHVK